jgi:benzodiazapine receptor
MSVLACLALATLPIILVAAAGGYATSLSVGDWYARLARPPGNPPNWVFGPVWTVLYILMAWSIWRLLSLPEGTPGRREAIVLFFVQLALNGAWSWAFFAARSPTFGLVVIVALVVAVGLAAAAALRVDRIAGWCLLPYLGWVLYATYLNVGIWFLNR